MNIKEIKQLVELINKSDLSEFKMRDKEFELIIRTKNYNKNKMIDGGSNLIPIPQQVMQNPQHQQPVAQAPAATQDSSNEGKSEGESQSSANLIEVKSPIVGTFYRSSSPDKPPFAKVGDTIEVGSVVCIVEAMKLFNEIESEVSGKIVKVMVEDASPVEYDQVLFLVEPN